MLFLINKTVRSVFLLFSGVTVKGQRHEQAYSFRLEDKGTIQSIKFNPDLSVLAIKRTSNSVEFLNFEPIPQTSTLSRSTTATLLQPDTSEYSQLLKTKSSKLYDFNWLSEKEIVFITEQSIEHFSLNVERRTLRSLKQYPLQNINWQLFSREINLLLISSGSPSGNSLTPFSFHKNQSQQLLKLPKFEVDLPQPVNQRPNSVVSTASTQSMSRRIYELTERDCMLGTLYGKSYLLVIRQVFRVPGQGSVEVVLYLIEDDHRPAQKRHILRLSLHGKCALNIVDNLVLIHHQPTKTTFIYDIDESSTSQHDGFQTIHEPLLPQLSIQPINVNWQLLPSSTIPTTPTMIELYSSNWVVFLPNVIIDIKMGCLWYLTVNLDYLLDVIPDRLLLLDILLRRTHGKASILTLLRTLLTNGISPVHIDSKTVTDTNSTTILDLWIEMIEKINRVFVEKSSTRPLLDQTDIHSVLNLFSTIVSITNCANTTTYRKLLVTSNDDISNENDYVKTLKLATTIIIEYIRSLNDFNIPVQYIIYELLVNLLVKNNQFFQLQQLIQYQVLADSLDLACLLLSFSNKQQPTTQIALDMLKRLSTAKEAILEILLGNNFIIEALHFSIEHLEMTRTLARKLLEAAIKSDELLSSTTSNQKILFYTVYTFFEEYFQRTSTISALAQTLNFNEQKDDLEMFKSLFNLHFRNQESDVTNIK